MTEALTLEQQKANRKLWVEALRSGKYEQARRKLVTNSGGHCCLGVLAAIAGVSVERMTGETSLRHLPDAMEFVGLQELSGAWDYTHCLASENDSGASFEDIADIIESEPPGLFTA